MSSPASQSKLKTAPFGATGHQSSHVIFGAAALGSMSQERADATLALLPQFGINHIDTAESYGESELRLTSFLADHRSDFFLATKTRDRTGPEARASLERSLERMKVDNVDLIQLHNLVEPDEWETVFGNDGALAALVQARDEGLCKFIGVTGHGTRIPGMHVRSLGEFEFDSVLFPYNYTMMGNNEYRSDVESLLGICSDRNVAVQTIKSVAKGRWGASPERRFSWYEPIDDPQALERAVHYVTGQNAPGTERADKPHLFLNSSSDARLLPQICQAAAQTGAVPSNEAMEADCSAHGITPLFDGAELERI